MPVSSIHKGMCKRRIRLKELLTKLISKMKKRLDDYNIKRKLQTFYIWCVLLPLIITDSVILFMVVDYENQTSQTSMQNIASTVKYNLSTTIENAATATKKIYMNRSINDFLDQKYTSYLDYYENYEVLMNYSLFETSIDVENSTLTLYANNKTITNGGGVSQVNVVRNTSWYRTITNSNQDALLYIYFDKGVQNITPKRKIVFLRKLNLYEKENNEKLVKLDLDYSSMVQNFLKMNYERKVYVCFDGKVFLSNDGHTSVWQNFEPFQNKKEIGLKQSMDVYGISLDIYVLKPETGIGNQIIREMPFIILLILVNAVLPWFLMKTINYSFTFRLNYLSKVFERVNDERLTKIKSIRGNDEIGNLMRGYNRMVERINMLIQTAYIDRLREQDLAIAKQKAELLALHSQINPHFLFNALESIRMHSIIKKEYETASMVEQLAVMERQNVDWGTDMICVKEEIKFVESYLQLQKYRFGERLSYQIDMEQFCEMYQIPKLTIVTFVENACIHGIEKKPGQGWIFVHIYKKQQELNIEIEDTGNGMAEDFVLELKEKMRHANINQLTERGRVGIVNACLRLKMMTDNKVTFDVESEVGVSTMISIKIPIME